MIDQRRNFIVFLKEKPERGSEFQFGVEQLLHIPKASTQVSSTTKKERKDTQKAFLGGLMNLEVFYLLILVLFAFPSDFISPLRIVCNGF